MTKITKSSMREIVDDFVKEIDKCQRPGKPPKEDVIDFRNQLDEGITNSIVYVPVKLLRYRKDNGRISSDILHYEKLHGILDETSVEGFKLAKQKESLS